MGILAEKDVTALISAIEAFSYEVPDCRSKDIVSLIRDLFADYQELVSPNKKRHSTYLSSPKTRLRRRLKSFPHHTPAHVRIAGNVVKDDKTGCWIWPGSGTANHGYIVDDDGKNTTVHRVMFEHANGKKIRPGEVIRHTCDNGFCCNPAHLESGTQVENAADRVARNRSGVQKLTYKSAKTILLRFLKGESSRKLAARFNVSEGNIRRIGIASFKALNDDPDVKKIQRVFGQARRSKLKPKDVIAIRKRLRRGDAHGDIAAAYGVDRSVISGIKTGKLWKSVD
jgi:hypothetical protein